MSQVVYNKNIVIQASKEEVWEILGNLSRANDWIPGISNAKVEGDHRYCTTMDGHEIHEEITNYSEKDFSFNYNQVKTPLPVKSSKGKMWVERNGESSVVKWKFELDFNSNEMKENMEKFIDSNLDETLLKLKELVEKSSN